ncbi:MAG: hypothetical protein LBE76_07375 [Nitrososphaerota archaeon]|jgi:DNA-binding HxlR family transcriptional regulator|nr:hypothetical protein [Nitrososphaerota archaeon]
MDKETKQLYKILKDETNQKILTLTNEHGSLNYTNLMEKTETISERMLNYHLKSLNNLLTKNTEDQYILTEKGQTALKILTEELPKQKTLKKNNKKILHAISLIQITIITVTIVLYSQGYIDARNLRISIGWFIGTIIATCVAYRLEVKPLTPKLITDRKFTGLYIIYGGIAGLIIIFLGTTITSVISVSIDGPNLLQATSSNIVFFFCYLISATVIGCLTGYYIGKKNNFKKPKWFN